MSQTLNIVDDAIVPKNDKKTIKAWALFDWANSAYSLVISTAIFPVYFVKSTPEKINLLGMEFSNGALYSFSVSFSYIIIAMLSPILSNIADYSGKRMFFLKLFTIIGAVNCSILYFFKGEPQMWLGTTAFILGTIGFAGSLVFYDSYLPTIATKDQFDKVSAKGYSYGYIGSVLLLLFILFMVQKPEVFGIVNSALPARLGFLLVGLWWLGWSQYTFRNLPKDRKEKFNLTNLKLGYTEIIKVFKIALTNKNLVNYLVSFLLYSAGVQTVVYLASIFGEQELKMETAELIMTILIIQLVAVVGSLFFARVSGRIGNKNTLLIQIFIWSLICVLAYYTQTKEMFYFIAFLVGMVLGGIQSLSRATYSKILQDVDNYEQDQVTYFSLSDTLYKLSIVSGTFLFGLAHQLTGSMRYSVLVLMTLFIFSFFFMWRVKLKNE
jgi:MFS transporter, UMF1 family